MEALMVYRDGIQFVHDQTIRLMNKGMHPEEIIENMELPSAIASSPYLCKSFTEQLGGLLKVFSMDIWDGFQGIFLNLIPLRHLKKQIFISNMIGAAPKHLFEEFENAIANSRNAVGLRAVRPFISFRTSLRKRQMRHRSKAAFYLGNHGFKSKQKKLFSK
jgi:hypothetical protein